MTKLRVPLLPGEFRARITRGEWHHVVRGLGGKREERDGENGEQGEGANHMFDVFLF
jgi:hypothetical protein